MAAVALIVAKHEVCAFPRSTVFARSIIFEVVIMRMSARVAVETVFVPWGTAVSSSCRLPPKPSLLRRPFRPCPPTPAKKSTLPWPNARTNEQPLDPDSEEDKETANRFVEFQLAWWADPIYFGDYPTWVLFEHGIRAILFFCL